MTRQTRELYVTGTPLIDYFLARIADRLDLLEGLRSDLDIGYFKLTDGKTVITTNAPLETDEVLGTENEITVTDNGDETITISLQNPLIIPGDVGITGHITWTKITAASVTVTVGGTDATSVVANLQTAHDGNVFHLDEVAAPPGIDFYIEFTSVTAFNWVNILAQYDGATAHDMTVQLYNWNTTAWNTFSGIPCMNYDTTPNPTFNNGDFFVPDDTNYIGTGGDAGKVRVRFVHFTSGNASHDLYVDVVALYK